MSPKISGIHVKGNGKNMSIKRNPILPKVIDWVHIIIITLLFWMVYITIFDHKPDMNGDNFAYYLLGKRIATGQGFTSATDIHHAPHTHFPIGYPALIAFFIRTIGDDQDSINFMNGLMMYGSLLLLYILFKQLTASSSTAFAATIITSLNSHLLRGSTTTMSEVPFLFLSMLALFSLLKALRDQKGVTNIWLYLVILTISACYYMRTIAVALIAGVLLYLIFSKKWKTFTVTLFTFLLLALPGYIRARKLGSSHMQQLMQVNPYNPELGKLTAHGLMERIHNNLVRYISIDIPSGALSLDSSFDSAPVYFWVLGILISLLTLWGIYRLKEFRLLLVSYIGGTFMILLIWPDVWGGIRFIVPLIPLIIALLFNGFKELLTLILPSGIIKYIPYTFCLLGLIYTKPIAAIEDQANQPIPPNYANYFDIARWAKENTKEDAIFSARKPDMFVYYSDRTCVPYKYSTSDTAVLNFFRENNVDYIIIEQLGFSSTGKYLVPAIQKNPDKFEIVYQLKNPDTYLLKFKR